MGQNMHAKNGSITHRSTASLRIPVDDSLIYMIKIMDPKLNFMTYDPDINKGIVLERAPDAVSTIVPMKVDVFRYKAQTFDVYPYFPTNISGDKT